MLVYIYVCTYICICIRIRIGIYVYVYIYIYIYVSVAVLDQTCQVRPSEQRASRADMSGEVELTLQPDAEVVSLQHSRGVDFLVSSKTGEHLALDPTAGPFELVAHDGAFCYIRSPSGTTWAADKLKFPVFENDDNQECVIVDEQEVLLSDYIEKGFMDIQLPFSFAPVGDRVFVVHGWHVPKDGARLRWHALELFVQLKLTAQHGQACRWAGHGWTRWQEFLKDLGLGGSHMIKKDMSNSITEAGSSEEVGDHRAMSTHALVACLVRWSALPPCKGGLGTAGDKQNVLGLLDALVAVAVGVGVKAWTCFVDQACSWAPPSLPTGRVQIDIIIERGKLMLQPFATLGSPFSKAIVKAMIAAGVWQDGRVGMRDALQASLSQQTPKSQGLLVWFFKQLVWFVGSVCDEELFTTKCKDIMRPAFSSSSETQKARNLTRYFLTMRREFEEPKVLHMALDGSTLFNKSTVVGIITKPSNVGVSFPPQVYKQ